MSRSGHSALESSVTHNVATDAQRHQSLSEAGLQRHPAHAQGVAPPQLHRHDLTAVGPAGQRGATAAVGVEPGGRGHREYSTSHSLVSSVIVDCPRSVQRPVTPANLPVPPTNRPTCANSVLTEPGFQVNSY